MNPAAPRTEKTWPRLLCFFLVLIVLFAAELTHWGQTFFVRPFTAGLAGVSGGLLVLVDPSVTVTGNVIQNTVSGAGVSIEPGCNGVEAMIMLTAAMLAFPAPWLYRLIGLALGFAAVQGLNLLRIVSLFYLLQWNPVWFEWAHLYLWQALIMLDVLVVFLIWLRRLPAVDVPHG